MMCIDRFLLELDLPYDDEKISLKDGKIVFMMRKLATVK